MARYTPAQVEQKFDAYKAATDRLDSLKRSESYFDTEYTGDDRDKHLLAVRQMIVQMEGLLAGMSAPKPIGQLHRENPEMTVDILALMVNDLRKYFIVDRMITDSGIESLCPLIVVTYPSLTLEEIALCFCQAKKGFYGEDFQRLDGSTIMKWLRIYCEDRAQRLMNKQYTKEVGHKAGKDIGRTEISVSMREGLIRAQAALEIEKARRK